MARFLKVMLALVAIGIALASYGCSRSSQSGYLIGITQHRPASWADAVREGFVAGLREQGWVQDKDFRIVYQSADGDPRVMRQIASQFVAEKVDLIFAVSTQSAQMAASATKTIPILFGAVTDPVEAQLVATIDKPGGNITGSSDQWPVREQLLLLQEMAPGLKSIGVVHNPGEANSEANMKVVRALCREFGWTLVEAPAATTNDVYRAAASLKGRCDGMYVPASNTVIEAADAVAIAAAEAHVPVVAGEETAVQKGAIATFSINYADIGRLNAQQAVRILKGEAQPGDLPVAVPTQFELVINRAAAARIGVDLPPQMIARAKRIIE